MRAPGNTWRGNFPFPSEVRFKQKKYPTTTGKKRQNPERGAAPRPAWWDFGTRKKRQHGKRQMEGTREQFQHDKGNASTALGCLGCARHIQGTTSDTKQHHPGPKPTRMGTSIPISAGKHPGFNRMAPTSFALNTKPFDVGTRGCNKAGQRRGAVTSITLPPRKI